MVLFPCEYPSYMFKFSYGGVQLSRLHLREEGRKGGGGCISLRGNIPLGGNNLFAACYRDVEEKNY